MAGTFCGVLIFIIFVVDLPIARISTQKFNACGDIVHVAMMGVAKIIVVAWPVVYGISKN